MQYKIAVSLKRRIRGFIEKGTMVSAEKYFSLNSDLQKHKAEVSELISKKDEEIVRLEDANNGLNNDINELKNYQVLPSDIAEGGFDEFHSKFLKIIHGFKESCDGG